MELVDPIREYCHLPETEEETDVIEELPAFYEDHLNSTVQQIDDGNEENFELSFQDLVHGDELENMSQSSEDLSLDSMETAFSSDDPTLAELQEPSCQKILESDMKHASPIMDRLCLDMQEFQKNYREFIDTAPPHRPDTPDSMDFESIGDWDFMKGSDVRPIRSCSSPDSSLQEYSNTYFSDDENFAGSPTEKIADLIVNEFDYYTHCVRPEPIIETVYQQPAQVFQIPFEEESQPQTFIINQSSIVPIYAEPIQMITTVQNAFAQENFIVNSTTKKFKSQLIAKMGEKEQKKSRTVSVSKESKPQQNKEPGVRAVKIQLKIE